jgi:hypothetical protein
LRWHRQHSCRIIGLERKIVAIKDESLGALVDSINDVGQVDEILLFDLDQAQALGGVLVEQRLDER